MRGSKSRIRSGSTPRILTRYAPSRLMPPHICPSQSDLVPGSQRVDVRQSSKHVVVKVDDVEVANTHQPRLLFETSLRTRTYIPKTDCRLDLLQPSQLTTECPYKASSLLPSAVCLILIDSCSGCGELLFDSSPQRRRAGKRCGLVVPQPAARVRYHPGLSRILRREGGRLGRRSQAAQVVVRHRESYKINTKCARNSIHLIIKVTI